MTNEKEKNPSALEELRQLKRTDRIKSLDIHEPELKGFNAENIFHIDEEPEKKTLFGKRSAKTHVKINENIFDDEVSESVDITPNTSIEEVEAAGCRDGKAGTGRPHHLADRGDAAHFFGELFHYQPEFPGDLPGSVRRRRGTPGTHRPGKCTGIGHRDQGRTAGKGHQESDLSVRRRTVVCGNRYLFCHSAAAAVSVLYSGRD